jgi:hypothetical protein
MIVGKNVSLKLSNLTLIQDYMNKTRKGFSKTLNIMLKEWDKYSLQIQELERRQEEVRKKELFAQMKKAKVGIK